MDENKNNREYKERIRKIIHQLISANRKHRRIMETLLDKTGVFRAQHHLLMNISSNRFDSQKELAESMEVSTATIAVSLKKLEKGGYVNKIMDNTDNRLNQITITEKGIKVVEESKQIFDSTDKKVFEGFTEEELDSFSFLLQKLDANLVKIENNIKSK